MVLYNWNYINYQETYFNNIYYIDFKKNVVKIQQIQKIIIKGCFKEFNINGDNKIFIFCWLFKH